MGVECACCVCGRRSGGCEERESGEYGFGDHPPLHRRKVQGTKETIQKAGLNTNNVSDFQAWVIRFFSSQVAPQFFAFSKVKMKIQSVFLPHLP